MDSHEICHRALASRDPRFDGRLFVGVVTTGIYCRPICPSRTPLAKNCRFFPSAAAAQAAGFRPCLRCRPEISPDAAAWRGTSNTVSRALTLIAEGALDDGDVEALGEKLGLGERQLRRLFEKHLGAPPIAVAQTRRLLFAKQLLQETHLPMTQIAAASGFGSLRRFNDTFAKLYGRAPGSLRRQGKSAPSLVRLKLSYRPPYDWDEMQGFLVRHAVKGVEHIERNRYSRVIEIDGVCGAIEIAPGKGYLSATIRFPKVGALLGIVARLRRMFDLDADVGVIAAHLSADPGLAALIARRPGLRTPGAWDGFELAVRAILGQQISVAAARALAGKLTVLAGRALSPDVTGSEYLTHAFATPRRIIAADLSTLGMPRARREALCAMARATLADGRLLEPTGTFDEARARLQALPGFGPWTAQYWALRALRDADAFPETDVALLRNPAVAQKGKRPSPKALLARAESWRPWRAYAAQHLWTPNAE
jgi:AraC family transcriptional regulator of adaptative response / DNA-3-methyladenine glycosylase II